MSDYADKNELYHWLKGKEKPGHKYTSRYMKNGKWRYVYGAAKNLGDRVKDWWGVDERERLNKASWNYTLARQDYNSAKRNNYTRPDYKINPELEDAFKNGKNFKGNMFVSDDFTDTRTGKKTKNYDPTNVNRQAARNLTSARKAYEKARDDYYKTPMGKLNEIGSTVDKALTKGSNWIEGKVKSFKKKLSELSGGKKKLAKANRATVDYSTSIIINSKKYNNKHNVSPEVQLNRNFVDAVNNHKDYNGKMFEPTGRVIDTRTGKASHDWDPDQFDRQNLNAKRNAYQRSQDAYNKSLRGRINNAFTRKKKKKNK